MKLQKCMVLTGAIVAVALEGCQVQWVSKYDEQTDRNVTSYQKNLNIYFERLKELSWPECSYASNSNSYASALGDATVILTRAQSLQKNDQTIVQATALKDNLIEVKTTHKDSDSDQECLSEDYIRKSQEFMNQIVRAILWLEQGKKRQLGKVTRDSQEPSTTLPDSLKPKQD